MGIRSLLKKIINIEILEKNNQNIYDEFGIILKGSSVITHHNF